MIQELFGSASSLLGAGERKLISISDAGIILEGTPATSASSSPSPLASPSSSANTVAATKTGGGTKACGVSGTPGSNGTCQSSEGQSLRCPRCDSSNTKFCYYNNYNLTQPRHFCKTCRRYWTKGGALRNVPIGGGCRKNKTSIVSSAAAKSGISKFKSLASAGFMGGLDHELPSNPVMWASPHSSPLLALLRGAPMSPNPSPSPNPIPIPFMKEEMNMFRTEAGMASDGGMTSHGLGLDPLNQLPSIGLCSSFWRNNQQHSAIQQDQANHQSHHHNGYMLGEGQNNNIAIQALYQRLKLSADDYTPEHRSPLAATTSSSHGMATPPTSTSSLLESAPSAVGGDHLQMGYWSSNPNMCWSDLPTSNGAYP